MVFRLKGLYLESNSIWESRVKKSLPVIKRISQADQIDVLRNADQHDGSFHDLAIFNDLRPPKG